MEWLLGLGLWFWAWMVTWPFILLFVVYTIYMCADDEPGIFAFFASVLIGALIVNYFDIPWETYKWVVYFYIPIGFVWSFVRFAFYSRYIRTKSKERYPNDKEKRIQMQKEYLNVWENSSRIVYWISSWPASAISSGLKDFVEVLRSIGSVIKAIVVNQCRKIYEGIASLFIES